MMRRKIVTPIYSEGSEQLMNSKKSYRSPWPLIAIAAFFALLSICMLVAIARAQATLQPTQGHAVYAQGFKWALCVDHFEDRPVGCDPSVQRGQGLPNACTGTVTFYVSRPANPNAVLADDRYGKPCKGSRGGEIASCADIEPWGRSTENPLNLVNNTHWNCDKNDLPYFYNSPQPSIPSPNASGSTAYEHYDRIARAWAASQQPPTNPTPTPTTSPTPPPNVCLTGQCIPECPQNCPPATTPSPSLPPPQPTPTATPVTTPPTVVCPSPTPCPACPQPLPCPVFDAMPAKVRATINRGLNQIGKGHAADRDAAKAWMAAHPDIRTPRSSGGGQ